MIEEFPEEVHRENLWERKPLIQYNTNDINLGYKWQNKQHKTNYVTRYNTKQYPHQAKHIQYPHPAKGNPHPTPPYPTEWAKTETTLNIIRNKLPFEVGLKTGIRG